METILALLFLLCLLAAPVILIVFIRNAVSTSASLKSTEAARRGDIAEARRQLARSNRWLWPFTPKSSRETVRRLK